MSLKDGFSLDSPAGRLHARILASVDEYETEIRCERISAGQSVARKRGQERGGSKKGWRWKVSQEVEEEILRMRSAGNSVSQISRITNLSRPTVYAVLGGKGVG